jgi:very-short-patch-repair endonuclease
VRKRIIPYNPKLVTLAKNLRNRGTVAEIKLWQCLKGKQILGYDFDRQKPIDNYIVDFFCNELMLAIEIDGITHDQKLEDDKLRQQKLESFGIRFLRFYDSDVRNNLDGVLTAIRDWITRNVRREPTP